MRVQFLLSVFLLIMRTKKDKLTFYSEPNVEIMPCSCCMQSNNLEKVPTHLMSSVYTLGFEPIFVRRSITIQTTCKTYTIIHYFSQRMRYGYISHAH